MAPAWLTAVAWLYLSVCFCCAGIIACDIAFNRRRQPMGVMNFVFPITALYFGPFALALYWRWGRAAARTAMAADGHEPGSGVSGSSGIGGRRPADARRPDAHHDMAGAAGPDGMTSRHRRVSGPGHGGSRWPSR